MMIGMERIRMIRLRNRRMQLSRRYPFGWVRKGEGVEQRGMSFVWICTFSISLWWSCVKLTMSRDQHCTR